jgi:O-methyltransferase
MRNLLVEIFRLFGLSVSAFDEKRYLSRLSYFSNKKIYDKFARFTMVPVFTFLDNLELASKARSIPGDIVECGVWRGGMMAGISEKLGNDRKYWLFDSFEGLPPAKEIDGPEAVSWQKDKKGENYFDNCAAEEKFAREAMQLAGARNYELVRGWFKDTLPITSVERISVLRLDGDWYDSTMDCLTHLYPKVVDGGVIIIDDYYFWDGCTKAVHDYLSHHNICDRIRQTSYGVAYIIRNSTNNPLKK